MPGSAQQLRVHSKQARLASQTFSNLIADFLEATRSCPTVSPVSFAICLTVIQRRFSAGGAVYVVPQWSWARRVLTAIIRNITLMDDAQIGPVTRLLVEKKIDFFPRHGIEPGPLANVRSGQNNTKPRAGDVLGRLGRGGRVPSFSVFWGLACQRATCVQELHPPELDQKFSDCRPGAKVAGEQLT